MVSHVENHPVDILAGLQVNTLVDGFSIWDLLFGSGGIRQHSRGLA